MRRARALVLAACAAACAVAPQAVGATPRTDMDALAAATARELRTAGVAVRVGPVRFATVNPAVRADPATVIVLPSERSGLRRSAATLARGRGLLSPAAVQALVAAQIRSRASARSIGDDERARSFELGASEAVAADLTPRVLRRLGAGGFSAPIGLDSSEPELPTQALWLRKVSGLLCGCAAGAPGARAVRLRFLRASDPTRQAMVATLEPVPMISGPYGD